MNWLVVNSLTAVALTLLTLAIDRWGKPAPAVMHVLWLFVLLKLVTPPLFEVPIDVSWASEPAAVRTVVLPLSLDNSTPASIAPDAAPGVLRIAAPTWSWRRIAVLAWALGAGAMLVWFAIGFGRARRRLRTFAAVPAWLRDEVHALATQLGVAVPDLRDDPQAPSPYVWSFGRTCLVLPVRILAGTQPRGRKAVLAHELAHLRRNDHWLAHGEVLFAIVLWWHPLFWFARARLRLWSELACDAWAVAAVPDSCHAYAAVLVDAAARPDSSVPASVVLAARPTARAAFERRLTMILNENVPCRASRAWWLPFTSLALGLFAMPVAAQKGAQDPVKVEIRVNGKQVEDLDAAERTALLEKLLGAEKKAAAKGKQPKQPKLPLGELLDDAEPKADVAPRSKGKQKPIVIELDSSSSEPKPMPTPKPTKKSKKDKSADPFLEIEEVAGLEGLDIKAMMKQGLAEARLEIEGDEDLRELGITAEVAQLIDDLAAGKGIEHSLDGVIRGAMKGASKMVEKELRADPDLKELGMTDGILSLVNGLLQNKSNQKMVADLVRQLMDEAVEGAMIEVRTDPDLKELGIGTDVESLIESLLRGGDVDSSLRNVIDKATKAAMKQAETEIQVELQDVTPEPEVQPKPKAAKKGKQQKRANENSLDNSQPLPR